MSAVDKRIELIEQILNDKINVKDVYKEIKKMEEVYGEEAFIKTNYVERKKPWSNEYYKELRQLANSGASSKEFIIHLALVKDDLKKKKYIKTGVIVTGALILIVLGYRLLFS